eukprot:m.1385083 g.1385083  ORF g.1385083 m.1385083 type:complete len:151 (+) comp24975_c1_seq34:796-1248(+)
MIGRMLLERPAFQRKDIVEHEQTLSSWRFYVSQKALLATTLREDFATLQDTVHHHLQEVLTLQRTKAVEAEARAAFDAVRLRLKEKVLTWHHARLDAARQRESLDALRERDRTALQGLCLCGCVSVSLCLCVPVSLCLYLCVSVPVSMSL